MIVIGFIHTRKKMTTDLWNNRMFITECSFLLTGIFSALWKRHDISKEGPEEKETMEKPCKDYSKPALQNLQLFSW